MLTRRISLATGRVIVILLALALLSPMPVDRAAAGSAVFVVANTQDSGPGSLRQAIINAQGEPGFGILITFNIPLNDPGCGLHTPGVCTIVLGSPLPAITGGTTWIDGSWQKTNRGDSNPYGPSIEIDGESAGGPAIFELKSGGNSIRGLVINGGTNIAVLIPGGAFGYADNDISNNYIGTDATGQLARPNTTGIEIAGGTNYTTILSNTIAGNRLDGIVIAGSDTDHTQIRHNAIGLTAQSQTLLPNGRYGIVVSDGAKGTVIGGSSWTDMNRVWGNGAHGIYLVGTQDTTVAHNWIQMNGQDGVALEGGTITSHIDDNDIHFNDAHGIWIAGSGTFGNAVRGNDLYGNTLHGVAIYDGAEQNYIGGASLATGNVILYSGWSGVALVNSNGNTVENNRIGRDPATGATDLGNRYYGVAVVDGSGNTIGPGNLIADNGLTTVPPSDGVWVDGGMAWHNKITHNSIFANGGKGIHISNGANTSLAAPKLTRWEFPAFAWRWNTTSTTL